VIKNLPGMIDLTYARIKNVSIRKRQP